MTENGIVPSDAPKGPAGDPLEKVGEAMPAVQPHAIDAAQKQAAEQAAPTQPSGTAPVPPVVPPSGKEAFDPAIHETDPTTGKPRTTKDGGFRRKRGGGARKLNTTGTAKPVQGGTAAPMGPAPIDEVKLQNAAVNSAMLLFGIGQMIGGEEWAPIKKRINADLEIDERAQMTMAFSDYYRSRGIIDIPPGIVLCVVVVSYASARFQMPKTKSRWEKFKIWFSIYILKRKAKAAEKSDSENAKADTAKTAEGVDVRN